MPAAVVGQPVAGPLTAIQALGLRTAGMEHVCTFLLLITLSTLCRAELSDTWYSANVINDGGYSPKPISEIFTSERPFSETQPIVVLPHSSTPKAPLSTSEIPTSSYSTTQAPSSFNPSSASTPYPTQEYSNPTSFSTQSSYQPPSSSFGTPTPFTQDPSTLSNSNSNFDLRQPFFFPIPTDKQIPNAPNYFLIYQNVPQPQPPFSSPQPSVSTSSPSSFAPSTTFKPDLTAPQSTWSTFETNPPTQSTTPFTIQTETTTFTPSTATPTFATFQPSSDSTFPSINPSSFSPTSTTPSETTPLATRSPSPSTIPCNTTNVGSGLPPKFPTLKIRMVAPSGSITNINVNPVIKTTTKRPQTTRTKRPTTTRTRRTKKTRNNYDSCINGCGERRPICATPLAVTPIDPDRLKGFPTVCHMACHNSFRKEQYQMVVEGRCGRLRTRIQTFDSSDKIKKVELNKAQYTVVSNEPQAVVFLSDISR